MWRTGAFGLLRNLDSSDSSRPFSSISSLLPLTTSTPGSTPYNTFLQNSLRNSLTIYTKPSAKTGSLWGTTEGGTGGGCPEPLEISLDQMDHRFTLIDFPLFENIFMISNFPYADLRIIFEGALVESRPLNSVTFVMNHDTQPCQDAEKIIPNHFKLLDYALILLRAERYCAVETGAIKSTLIFIYFLQWSC